MSKKDINPITRTLSFPYGDTIIRFETRYSTGRRTIQITVEPPGTVTVLAPSGRSDRELIETVSKKARWITQKLALMQSVRSQIETRKLIGVEAEDQANRLICLTAWYHDRAAERIGERIQFYARQMGVSPRAVRIRNQKKRWGSCTSAGNLYINWRCILAPAPILDYIVVHELCHLLVMNHSAKFWACVRSILPDFEDRRKWLRVNGMTLDINDLQGHRIT